MMYFLGVYVPFSHKESLKKALFEAGAGQIGSYSECSWETSGVGQYKPGQKASPTLGKKGKIKKISEYKLEMVIDAALINPVYQALKQHHPYEEPAFHFFPVFDPDDISKFPE